MTKYLTFLKDHLDEIEGWIEPCSIEEIRTYENVHNISLPKAYVEFLLLIGRSSGDLFYGSDVSLIYIDQMHSDGNKILRRNQQPQLTNNEIVFYMHQNYSFCYFRLNEGDDPPIYLCIEGDAPFEHKKWYNFFTDFVHDELDIYIKRKHYRKGKRKSLPIRGDDKLFPKY